MGFNSSSTYVHLYSGIQFIIKYRIFIPQVFNTWWMEQLSRENNKISRTRHDKNRSVRCACLVQNLQLIKEMSSTNDSVSRLFVCAWAVRVAEIGLDVVLFPCRLRKIIIPCQLINTSETGRIAGAAESSLLPRFFHPCCVASSDNIALHIYIIHHSAAIVSI